MSDLAADEFFIFCLCNRDRRSGRNPFRKLRIAAGQKNQLFFFNQNIIQLLVLGIGSQAGQIDIAVQNSRLCVCRTAFPHIYLYMWVFGIKSGKDIGHDLHGPLYRNSQLDGAMLFVVDFFNFFNQVVIDGEDFFGSFYVFFSRISQSNGIR